MLEISAKIQQKLQKIYNIKELTNKETLEDIS